MNNPCFFDFMCGHRSGSHTEIPSLWRVEIEARFKAGKSAWFAVFHAHQEGKSIQRLAEDRDVDMSNWPKMNELDRLISIADWSCLVKHGEKRMTDGSDPRTRPPPHCRLLTADDLVGSKNKHKKKTKAKQQQQVDIAAAPTLRAEKPSHAADDQASAQAPAKPRRDVSDKAPIEAELHMRATNSAADTAATSKSRSGVLEDVQAMDVDFTAGVSSPKGTARKRPRERAHKQVAFKFEANDVKVPTSHPPTSGSPATTPSPAPGVTATVDVQQLENEVHGVISDVRVLKDSVASLEHSQVIADVYMEMLLQAQGISLDQAKSRIEAGKQHLRLSQQQRGLLILPAPPTTSERPRKGTNIAVLHHSPVRRDMLRPTLSRVVTKPPSTSTTSPSRIRHRECANVR